MGEDMNQLLLVQTRHLKQIEIFKQRKEVPSPSGKSQALENQSKLQSLPSNVLSLPHWLSYLKSLNLSFLEYRTVTSAVVCLRR